MFGADQMQKNDCVAQDFGGGDEVAFAVHGHLGLIRLTRPKALNALTHNMVKAIERALLHWQQDAQVSAVLVEGEGRAFCAGGDVVAVYHAGKNGSPDYAFFEDEYRLNRLIASFTKPYIAFLDGITMGGGAGVSVHGSHRIVTENTRFAMPESGIGFFTDVGGSAFLPFLPQKFGYYLGLTGSVIGWGDCLNSGIATHALLSEQLEHVRNRLIAGEKPDDILSSLQLAQPDWESAAADRAMIEQCCIADSVEQIVANFARAANDNEKAAGIHQVLLSRSPTSLKAIFMLFTDASVFIRANKDISYSARMDRQMQIEYALAEILLQRPDFYAGVGAVLIEKTGKPVWQPATLAEVELSNFVKHDR